MNIVYLATCILTLFFFSNTVTAETPGAKALKIGVVGPFTGEGSEYSKPMLEGIKLAAKDFNGAGGIGGRKIDFIIKDNKGDYAKTVGATEELINDKVVAILASPSGWSTFSPVSMANYSKTIFMSIGSQRHVGRSGPYIFRNSLSDETATEETVRYCKEKLGCKRYVIITSMVDDEASLSVAGLFRRALQKFGAAMVAEAYTSYDMGIKEAVAKLKSDAKGPIDAVIFAGYAGNAVDILKELREQGISAPLIGSENLYAKELLEQGGEAAVGTLFYASFTPLSVAPSTVRFVKNYRAATGGEPTSLSALGYDSFMLIAEAAKKAGKTDPSKVRNALAGIKGYKGVSGTISMGEDGESVNTPYILRVEKGAKGPEFRLVK